MYPRLFYSAVSRKIVFFILAGFAVPAFAALDNGLDTAAAGTALASRKDFNTIAAQLISNVLAIVGVIFLILIISGGVMWMLSGGNEKKVADAKKIITTATIGLVIVMLGYAVTYFVITSIQNAVDNSDSVTGGT